LQLRIATNHKNAGWAAISACWFVSWRNSYSKIPRRIPRWKNFTTLTSPYNTPEMYNLGLHMVKPGPEISFNMFLAHALLQTWNRVDEE
jgi:hypothetical protein